MAVLAFLGRLVVIRHHLQLAVGANLFGKAGQLYGFCGGIGAATGHHGDTAFGLLNRHADDFAVFFHGDGGRLAGGAHHAEAVGAFGNVPVHQFAQGRVIHAAVVMQRSSECNDAAGDGFHVGVSGGGRLVKSGLPKSQSRILLSAPG